MRKQLFLAGIVLLSSACNKEPEGQTVAVVNGKEVTASELNAEFAGANLPPNADRKQATNAILQQLIDRRLLAEQARKDGIDRSPEFIARERRLEEDLLIGMLSNRQMDSSKLPTEAEIASIQARQPQAFAKRELWRLAQVQYETPSDARVQQAIANTKSMDELIGVLTSARVPFQRASNQLSTSLIPNEIYPQLTGLSPGEPFIVPAGGRSVASVIIEREPMPLTGPQARTEAVNLIRRQTVNNSLQQRIKDLRSAAKIEYKEGFGPAK